jgi:predicted RNA polymerase sigma factor
MPQPSRRVGAKPWGQRITRAKAKIKAARIPYRGNNGETAYLTRRRDQLG